MRLRKRFTRRLTASLKKENGAAITCRHNIEYSRNYKRGTFWSLKETADGAPLIRIMITELKHVWPRQLVLIFRRGEKTYLGQVWYIGYFSFLSKPDT